ncbi:hypothetical protein NDR87_35350 [Nocardia sp. CDC159]|uniref:Uncharacterized protein n=1 Tax=Nocardia pulmonis TaxID=2951408 RepID=A0A9X2J359_9NOCA|nr:MULTISPECIES: hypothetical protein [Nocardia]MCM6778766.1 hypothetical protein [Nocardia pulmonis]MCM6791655.1 hypothetical protein [Nocardia sp. CDC159]
MTTPHPRPHAAGPTPGVPLPGQHLSGANPAEFADPAAVRAEVDELLAELTAGARNSDPEQAGVDITRRARILEQAHDVLVRALATVDKI